MRDETFAAAKVDGQLPDRTQASADAGPVPPDTPVKKRSAEETPPPPPGAPDPVGDQNAAPDGAPTLSDLLAPHTGARTADLLSTIIAGHPQRLRDEGGGNLATASATDEARAAPGWFKPTKPEIDDPEAKAVANGIRESIAGIITTQQLEENQAELARISNLLPRYAILFEQNRLRNLALAVAALASDKPNTSFAASVRSDCELSVLRSQRGLFRVVALVSGSTSISATMSGLFFSALGMAVVATAIGAMLVVLRDKLGVLLPLEANWNLVFFMSIMAAAGSFVSVLSRLNTFTANRGYDAFLVFCTGFFKPWIGVVFGVFIYFVLKSNLINLQVLSDPARSDAQSLYVVLGFISGFSERLVSDFIGKTEVRILGAPNTTKPLDTAKVE